MERNAKISEAELEVMRVAWEAGRPLTGAEIVTILRQRAGWEDSTIYTLIRRLTKKNALRQEKRGVFCYTPAVTEEQYCTEQAQELLNRVFNGNAKSLVSALVKNQSLGREDLEELRKYWNNGEGPHE